MSEGTRSFPGKSRGLPLVALVVVTAAIVALPALASRPGHYTSAQADNGKQVYSAQCAGCHGARLQGGAGPALKGQKFQSSVEFGKMSTAQLFDFISKHMPKNSPGSLSRDQYLSVMAYLLEQNGFAAGDSALDKRSLQNITLLPLPKDSASQANGK